MEIGLTLPSRLQFVYQAPVEPLQALLNWQARIYTGRAERRTGLENPVPLHCRRPYRNPTQVGGLNMPWRKSEPLLRNSAI